MNAIMVSIKLPHKHGMIYHGGGEGVKGGNSVWVSQEISHRVC